MGACPSSPPSCSSRSRHTRSRSRRPRRSPPSTWQNTARPSKSLRRLRNVANWPRQDLASSVRPAVDPSTKEREDLDDSSQGNMDADMDFSIGRKKNNKKKNIFPVPNFKYK